MNRKLDLARLDPRVMLGATIASILALAALLARVGSDAGWLAALGHVIVAQGSVPHGVPFAAAPTAHWPNALVLAEVIFNGLAALGDRGLMGAQLLAVAGALFILARDARAGGADPVGVSGALLLTCVGALPTLAIARVQMFSLVLFPALVALLRAEARTPSRRLWLAVPLLALWSNLHGAALLGAGTLLVYAILERARHSPLESAGLGLAGVAALGVTPAGLHTVAYYAGLMSNQAVQRGQGMWGPLSLSSPFDLVLVVAGVWLAYRAWRSGIAVWETAMALALAALTVKAGRDGVWLLFFLAVPAARRLAPVRFLRALTPVAVLGSVVAIVFSVARGPVPTGIDRSLLARALTAAHGTPVLADGTIDEQVAMAGGRIWAGNPIDAFSRGVQTAYLDWLSGQDAGSSALGRAVRVVIVSRGSPTQALMARTPGFAPARSAGTAVMYERTN